MSYTPYNAPLLSGLLGDHECATFFSVAAEIDSANQFEAQLAKVQSELGVIPDKAAFKIGQVLRDFQPDVRDIYAATANDGVIIPNYVAQLREAVGEDYGQYVHFGATSQDVIDTSLILRLKRLNRLLMERLGDVISALDRLDQRFGDGQFMAHTRMQQALPISVSERLQNWIRPLSNAQTAYEGIKSNLEVVQLGGPVGTLQAFGEDGPKLRANLAEALSLQDPGCCWHTDRQRLTAYASWLTDITTALGKIGQDVMLMAQNERDEIAFATAGSSSAMPHKKNPIKAEVLVTFQRFNAGQLGTMRQAGLHEQERSGTNWTLEWMILPQIVMVGGASLQRAIDVLLDIERIGLSDKAQ